MASISSSLQELQLSDPPPDLEAFDQTQVNPTGVLQQQGESLLERVLELGVKHEDASNNGVNSVELPTCADSVPTGVEFLPQPASGVDSPPRAKSSNNGVNSAELPTCVDSVPPPTTGVESLPQPASGVDSSPLPRAESLNKGVSAPLSPLSAYRSQLGSSSEEAGNDDPFLSLSTLDWISQETLYAQQRCARVLKYALAHKREFAIQESQNIIFLMAMVARLTYPLKQMFPDSQASGTSRVKAETTVRKQAAAEVQPMKSQRPKAPTHADNYWRVIVLEKEHSPNWQPCPLPPICRQIYTGSTQSKALGLLQAQAQPPETPTPATKEELEAEAKSIATLLPQTQPPETPTPATKEKLELEAKSIAPLLPQAQPPETPTPATKEKLELEAKKKLMAEKEKQFWKSAKNPWEAVTDVTLDAIGTWLDDALQDGNMPKDTAEGVFSYQLLNLHFLKKDRPKTALAMKKYKPLIAAESRLAWDAWLQQNMGSLMLRPLHMMMDGTDQLPYLINEKDWKLATTHMTLQWVISNAVSTACSVGNCKTEDYTLDPVILVTTAVNLFKPKPNSQPDLLDELIQRGARFDSNRGRRDCLLNQCEDEIYFLTHLILVTSWWGTQPIQYPPRNSSDWSLWGKLATLLTIWLEALLVDSDTETKNREVALELACCLLIFCFNSVQIPPRAFYLFFKYISILQLLTRYRKDLRYERAGQKFTTYVGYCPIGRGRLHVDYHTHILLSMFLQMYRLCAEADKLQYVATLPEGGKFLEYIHFYDTSEVRKEYYRHWLFRDWRGSRRHPTGLVGHSRKRGLEARDSDSEDSDEEDKSDSETSLSSESDEDMTMAELKQNILERKKQADFKTARVSLTAARKKGKLTMSGVREVQGEMAAKRTVPSRGKMRAKRKESSTEDSNSSSSSSSSSNSDSSDSSDSSSSSSGSDSSDSDSSDSP